MKNFICISILILLTGCATTGTIITKDNSHIKTAHYSIDVPADQEWHFMMPPSNNELVLITKQFGPFVFQMKTMANFILDENLKKKSSKEIADDFRALEKNMMIENGVKKGLYELRDLRMEEETVGDKKFYTMNYVIISSSGTQNAALYLHFPKEQNNDYFFLAHYSETFPQNAFLARSFKSEFIETLSSLDIKNESHGLTSNQHGHTLRYAGYC